MLDRKIEKAAEDLAKRGIHLGYAEHHGLGTSIVDDGKVYISKYATKLGVVGGRHFSMIKNVINPALRTMISEVQDRANSRLNEVDAIEVITKYEVGDFVDSMVTSGVISPNDSVFIPFRLDPDTMEGFPYDGTGLGSIKRQTAITNDIVEMICDKYLRDFSLSNDDVSNVLSPIVSSDEFINLQYLYIIIKGLLEADVTLNMNYNISEKYSTYDVLTANLDYVGNKLYSMHSFINEAHDRGILAYIDDDKKISIMNKSDMGDKTIDALHGYALSKSGVVPMDIDVDEYKDKWKRHLSLTTLDRKVQALRDIVGYYALQWNLAEISMRKEITELSDYINNNTLAQKEDFISGFTDVELLDYKFMTHRIAERMFTINAVGKFMTYFDYHAGNADLSNEEISVLVLAEMVTDHVMLGITRK
jgi:hypothetical protein